MGAAYERARYGRTVRVLNLTEILESGGPTQCGAFDSATPSQSTVA